MGLPVENRFMRQLCALDSPPSIDLFFLRASGRALQDIVNRHQHIVHDFAKCGAAVHATVKVSGLSFGKPYCSAGEAGNPYARNVFAAVG